MVNRPPSSTAVPTHVESSTIHCSAVNGAPDPMMRNDVLGWVVSSQMTTEVANRATLAPGDTRSEMRGSRIPLVIQAVRSGDILSSRKDAVLGYLDHQPRKTG